MARVEIWDSNIEKMLQIKEVTGASITKQVNRLVAAGLADVDVEEKRERVTKTVITRGKKKIDRILNGDTK